MNIMTKRGGLDNIATFEHVCDRKADLDNIPKNQITLGSLAIVLKGENDGLEVYMANSKKEWILLMGSSGSGGGGSGIDLSQDTVDVLHLVEGYTAHDSTGAPIVGQVPIRTIDDLIQSGDIITMPGGYYTAATEIKMPPTEYKNLNLIDYDGTLLHAYTTAEALKLEELPEPPKHKELINDGYNWTLETIQRFLRRYPFDQIMIGAQYLLESNVVIELDIEITDSHYTSPMLTLQSSSGSVDIEIQWGDNTITTSTLPSNATHFYHDYDISNQRHFTIRILALSSIPSGKIILLKNFLKDPNSITENHARYFDYNDFIYLSYITKARLGQVQLQSQAFTRCSNLQSCVLTYDCLLYGSEIFMDAPKLKAIVTSKKFLSSTYACFQTSNATIISCGEEYDYIPYSSFENNINLQYLTLSPYLTYLGSYAFRECNSLRSLTIADYQTTSGTQFTLNTSYLTDNCYNLSTINLPKNIESNVTSHFIWSNKFLTKIILPETVKWIGMNAIQSLELTSIILPSTLEEISVLGIYSGKNIYPLNILLKATTPPTLTASNSISLTNHPFHTIYVPYSEDHSVLNAYKNATNWSRFADKIQEYQVISFTINGQAYTSIPFMNWYDWLFSEYNTNNDITIYYETNEMLAPNATVPFQELIQDTLHKTFLTDSPKDGAVYVTPQGGN